MSRGVQGRGEIGVCPLGGAGLKAHAPVGMLGEASSTEDLGDAGGACTCTRGQASRARHPTPESSDVKDAPSTDDGRLAIKSER